MDTSKINYDISSKLAHAFHRAGYLAEIKYADGVLTVGPSSGKVNPETLYSINLTITDKLAESGDSPVFDISLDAPYELIPEVMGILLSKVKQIQPQ